MRILFFFILIITLSGCATVEVAKEVTKATKSIKTSVDNIVSLIEKDKEIVEIEKEKEKKIVIEQKKITKINFTEKKLYEIKKKIR